MHQFARQGRYAAAEDAPASDLIYDLRYAPPEILCMLDSWDPRKYHLPDAAGDVYAFGMLFVEVCDVEIRTSGL